MTPPPPFARSRLMGEGEADCVTPQVTKRLKAPRHGPELPGPWFMVFKLLTIEPGKLDKTSPVSVRPTVPLIGMACAGAPANPIVRNNPAVAILSILNMTASRLVVFSPDSLHRSLDCAES